MLSRLVCGCIYLKKNLFQNIKVNFPNVKQAFLQGVRSDEAGCYHCNHLIAAVKDIGDRVGITVARYDFSEPQQGKDVCDRVLCPMKAAIRKYCAEGHDIMNVGAMHEALKVPITKFFLFCHPNLHMKQ